MGQYHQKTSKFYVLIFDFKEVLNISKFTQIELLFGRYQMEHNGINLQNIRVIGVEFATAFIICAEFLSYVWEALAGIIRYRRKYWSNLLSLIVRSNKTERWTGVPSST